MALVTSRSQALQALEKANHVRLANAEVRQELRELDHQSARLRLAEMLDHPDELVLRQNVGRLLEALPRFGPSRAAKYLAKVGADPSRLVGQLSEIQRAKLIGLLEEPQGVK